MEVRAGEIRRGLNQSSSEGEFHTMARRPLPHRQFDFRRSASGSVAVQAAFLILLALGFVALGVEASQLLLEQRKQQSVADSAAMTAASAVMLGVSDLQAEARAVAAQLGYRDGVNNVTVTASNPPAAGTHAGDAQYVEVKVRRTYTPGLMQLFRQGPLTVQARAVAKAGQSSKTCLFALDTSGADALNVDNNAVLNMPGCGLATNSTSNSSINLHNNSTLNGSVTTAGDVLMGSAAAVSGSINRHSSVVTDPYVGVALPAKGSSKTVSGTTLSPGNYAAGWNFDNNTTITLQPGVYYVGTELKTKNNVTINGTGVTIIIDGDYAMDFGNGATLNLSAPTDATTYSTAGILFYSAASHTQKTQSIGNNGTLNLTGALYFPSQTVYFGNNVTTTGSTCTQVIGKNIQIQNNANLTFNSSCTGKGTTDIGSSSNASLAE